ncbi:MAG: Gfo/Idh/MocA family protein [Gemmataceae bacterium]
MTDRRDFLQAGLTGGVLLTSGLVHAAGPDTLKVGLVGCGGRGTGAAVNALRADGNVQLTAMGDMYGDRLESALKTLQNEGDLTKKIDVKPDHKFTGLDAYKKVLDSGVDVVLLTTPPGFRPMHLEAAVAAGKHVFCEKPMATDAPGVRRVIETCKKAKEKGLAVVAGFCYRYQRLKQELMKRVHDGDIGKITAVHTCYHAGSLWHRLREKGWDDFTAMLRNWPYYTWLSGDHIVEQAIHSIDKGAWALQDQSPIKCVGLGGRQSRTGPEFGHIFDHHYVCYEYKDGVKFFHSTRQQAGTKQEVSDFVYGTEGTASIVSQEVHKIVGKRPFQKSARGEMKANKDDMYQNEHDELFRSIRSGRVINDGEWMTKSTLLGIMGRMATYTGQEITWEMAMNSKEDLLPASLKEGPMPTPAVPKPGITKYS